MPATVIQDDLRARFGDRLICNEPMHRHTTFGVGGPADLFVEVMTAEEMTTAINLCRQHDEEFFVVGGGSNLLVSDDGYRGVIIKSNLCDFKRDGNDVTVGSGYNLEALIDKVCSLGLAGLEPLAGIKGTVGGAVYGNAGAYGGTVADHMTSALIALPGDRPRVEDKKYFEFSYRNSILKRTREVVLEVCFWFPDGSAEQLNERKQEILKMREQRHPTTDCSAGCFFKNIEKADEEYGKLSAGALLEKVGAKKITFGNAGVFRGHANILVNLGGAKADEIRELASRLKKMVEDQFGYTLEEEITYLGNFS